MTLLLAFRTGLANFQWPKSYQRAFLIKYDTTIKDWAYQNDPIYLLSEYREPIQYKYDDMFSLGNCPECGAAWVKEHQEEMEQSGTCWCCSFPNELHWHMRDTFENELMRIKKSSKSLHTDD